ncbi:3-oxoacyl-[acyl-carrier-protein] synthase III C-terminal domain-containing protein [Teredinibacter turnerae]|uniref:3-oxoacyl-[acyl-carrier-protein] synthase III C-terminal domain-containing protein n=1 Tax=Teredinibacter turnerae TaxID=2426 RepID=UPI000409A82F|nr:3-oxoacyl-[acyl-carrier-protein] synthase III C-terminal domain-containing protein [Teredinibacter turnerae]
MKTVKNNSDIFGIAAIEYLNPPIKYTVDQLHEKDLLLSEPDAMRELGFEYCLMWDKPATDALTEVVAKLLENSGTQPDEVDLLINATAVSESALVPPNYSAPTTHENRHLQQFMHSSAKAQDDLGLVNAKTMGISEISCSSLMTSLWTARALMIEEGLDTAVCVNVDKFPDGYKREVVYNVVSDSACAVLLKRDCKTNKIVTYDAMTRGYYWDSDRRQNEMIASYFTTGSRIVQRTLNKVGMTLSDVSLMIPHNVSMRSWQILSELIGYPIENVYTGNISEMAHSIAADNFINLKDIEEKGILKPGDITMLYTFGLGAHWGCMLLEA